jgi:hypothetical protein
MADTFYKDFLFAFLKNFLSFIIYIPIPLWEMFQ